MPIEHITTYAGGASVVFGTVALSGGSASVVTGMSKVLFVSAVADADTSNAVSWTISGGKVDFSAAGATEIAYMIVGLT